jgi:hypothetical protein
MSLFLRCLGGSVLLLLVGCDFAGDPDRFVNDAARPPVLLEATDFSSIQAGQHLTGFVPVELTLDSLAGRIQDVVLRFDGGQWSEYRSQPPYAFSIPAFSEEEGPTTLLAEITLRDVDHGLLDLASVPSIVIGTPVVIDHRAPTPVAMSVDRWDASGVHLSWEPNRDANFYAYVVLRQDEWTPPDDPWQPFPTVTVLDTIYDAGVRSFVDPVPPVTGLSASYTVAVSNRAESAQKPYVPATYGTAATLGDDPLSTFLLHPTRTEAYSTDGLFVTARTTNGGAFLWDRDLLTVVEMGYLMGARLAGVTADGEELVLYADGLDTETDRQAGEAVFVPVQNPAAARRWPLPDGVRALQVGPAGRLYGRTDTGRLLVLDADSGAEIASLNGVPATGLFQVLPDRMTLAFVHETVDTACTLTTVDAREDPALLAETPFSSDVWGCPHVVASEDAATLFVARRGEENIRVLDTRTLAPVRTAAIPLPGPGEIRYLERLGDRLLLGFNRGEPTVPYRRGQILDVSTGDLTVQNRWDLAADIESMRLDRPGASLLVESGYAPFGVPDRLWRLPLSR